MNKKLWLVPTTLMFVGSYGITNSVLNTRAAIIAQKSNNIVRGTQVRPSDTPPEVGQIYEYQLHDDLTWTATDKYPDDLDDASNPHYDSLYSRSSVTFHGEELKSDSAHVNEVYLPIDIQMDQTPYTSGSGWDGFGTVDPTGARNYNSEQLFFDDGVALTEAQKVDTPDENSASTDKYVTGWKNKSAYDSTAYSSTSFKNNGWVPVKYIHNGYIYLQQSVRTADSPSGAGTPTNYSYFGTGAKTASRYNYTNFNNNKLKYPLFVPAVATQTVVGTQTAHTYSESEITITGHDETISSDSTANITVDLLNPDGTIKTSITPSNIENTYNEKGSDVTVISLPKLTGLEPDTKYTFRVNYDSTAYPLKETTDKDTIDVPVSLTHADQEFPFTTPTYKATTISTLEAQNITKNSADIHYAFDNGDDIIDEVTLTIKDSKGEEILTKSLSTEVLTDTVAFTDNVKDNEVYTVVLDITAHASDDATLITNPSKSFNFSTDSVDPVVTSSEVSNTKLSTTLKWDIAPDVGSNLTASNIIVNKLYFVDETDSASPIKYDITNGAASESADSINNAVLSGQYTIFNGGVYAGKTAKIDPDKTYTWHIEADLTLPTSAVIAETPATRDTTITSASFTVTNEHYEIASIKDFTATNPTKTSIELGWNFAANDDTFVKLEITAKDGAGNEKVIKTIEDSSATSTIVTYDDYHNVFPNSDVWGSGATINDLGYQLTVKNIWGNDVTFNDSETTWGDRASYKGTFPEFTFTESNPLTIAKPTFTDLTQTNATINWDITENDYTITNIKVVDAADPEIIYATNLKDAKGSVTLGASTLNGANANLDPGKTYNLKLIVDSTDNYKTQDGAKNPKVNDPIESDAFTFNTVPLKEAKFNSTPTIKVDGDNGIDALTATVSWDVDPGDYTIDSIQIFDRTTDTTSTTAINPITTDAKGTFQITNSTPGITKLDYGTVHNFVIKLNATYKADSDVDQIHTESPLETITIKNHEESTLEGHITPGVRDLASQEFTIDWKFTKSVDDASLDSLYVANASDLTKPASDDLKLITLNNAGTNTTTISRKITNDDQKLDYVLVANTTDFAGTKHQETVSIPTQVDKYNPLTATFTSDVANSGMSTARVDWNISNNDEEVTGGISQIRIWQTSEYDRDNNLVALTADEQAATEQIIDAPETTGSATLKGLNKPTMEFNYRYEYDYTDMMTHTFKTVSIGSADNLADNPVMNTGEYKAAQLNSLTATSTADSVTVNWDINLGDDGADEYIEGVQGKFVSCYVNLKNDETGDTKTYSVDPEHQVGSHTFDGLDHLSNFTVTVEGIAKRAADNAATSQPAGSLYDFGTDTINQDGSVSVASVKVSTVADDAVFVEDSVKVGVENDFKSRTINISYALETKDSIIKDVEVQDKDGKIVKVNGVEALSKDTEGTIVISGLPMNETYSGYQLVAVVEENSTVTPIIPEHSIRYALDDVKTDDEREVSYDYNVTSVGTDSAVITFKLDSGDQDAARIQIVDGSGNIVAQQGFLGDGHGAVVTQLTISHLQPKSDYNYKVVVSKGTVHTETKSTKDSGDFPYANYDWVVISDGDSLNFKTENDVPVGAIVGGVLGGLFAVALGLFLAWWFLLRNKDDKDKKANNKPVKTDKPVEAKVVEEAKPVENTTIENKPEEVKPLETKPEEASTEDKKE